MGWGLHLTATASVPAIVPQLANENVVRLIVRRITEEHQHRSENRGGVGGSPQRGLVVAADNNLIGLHSLVMAPRAGKINALGRQHHERNLPMFPKMGTD